MKKYELYSVAISTDYKEGDIDISWQADYGFGHIAFEKDGDKTICHNESMSKDFVKAVLCKLVDDSVFDE